MPDQRDPLDVITQNTIAVLTHAPEHREEWLPIVRQAHLQAKAAGDLPMVALLNAVLKLLMGGQPNTINPVLVNPYAVFWERITQGITQWQQIEELKHIMMELSQLSSGPMDISLRIDRCRRALELLTREQLPVEWAEVMMNLGVAYANRIQGDKAENLEEAIRFFRQTLEVRTREQMPVEWAQVMVYLGNVYIYRIREDKAENLEEAIRRYHQALEVVTCEHMSTEWAEVMMNLGIAYANRTREDRAENHEEAIRCYRRALEVITREQTPVEWASTMLNLGNAYANRIREDKAENLEEAIRCYRRALEVITREQTPVEWASTMLNLGNACTDRIQGDKGENLEEAIRCYRHALGVRTREQMPVGWAQVMMNLGIAYCNRIREGRAENLEEAIRCYRQALEVVTREQMPVEWAQVMMNLGNAYAHRTRDDKAKNHEEAIPCYRQALEVITRETLPSNHRQAQCNLGNLYFDEQRWGEALQAYRAAIAAGDDLLAAAFSEIGRRAEVGEATLLFTRAAYCLLQTEQLAEALVMQDRGKTRLLAEALALGEASLSTLHQEQHQHLQRTRQLIRTLEVEMRLPTDTPARRDDRTLAEALRQARVDLNGLIDAIRKEHPDFMPQGLDLPGLLALIPPDGALVAPVITSQGSAVFVVPYGVSELSSEYIVHLEKFTDDGLRTLLIGTEEAPGWLREYITFRNSGALEAWEAAIARTTGDLWMSLLSHIHARLENLGIQRGASLLVMPSGGLQLLPLHAAWSMESGVKRYFIDDYEVIYAPSGYALDISRRRAAERKGQSALVAGINTYADPGVNPLINAVPEAEALAALFKTEPLSDSKATKNAIEAGAAGIAYLHLSCHGYFAWGDPLASGLVLYDDRLTLSEIIGKLDLDACRLVTLSACETGLTDVQQSPDEYVGLPAGFLQAGAPAVVSSLWSVNDRSTALLMERFYQNHLVGRNDLPPMSLPAALREAQHWLRDAKRKEIGDYYKSFLTTRMSKQDAQAAWMELDSQWKNPDDRPYASPFFWAAFTFSGAG